MSFLRCARRFWDNVRAFADREHQWRVWVDHDFSGGNYWDSFSERLNNLADTQALEWPYDSIGSVLRNEREASAMSILNDAVDELFRKNGDHLTDEQYLNTAEWRIILQAANDALKVMSESIE